MKPERLAPSINDVAFIQLKGEPYQRVISTPYSHETIDCSATLSNIALNTSYRERLACDIDSITHHLNGLLKGEGFYGIDGKIKQGQHLTFDEACVLITFVCSALNVPLQQALAKHIGTLPPHETHLLQATALLAAMSVKESYVGLTAEEIAGMVAATIKLDTIIRVPHAGEILAFGGMGGDRGYPIADGRSKLFSLSTLSAVALATQAPVHKHHSYPNTSKVAGQSAIESYGARSDFHSQEAFEHVLDETQLLMTSCHDTRTLHTLSHRLRGETVNHVIGPLSFTLDAQAPVQALIGVNEKIHPQTVVDALRILDLYGFQCYKSAAVYCGTDLIDISRDFLLPETYQQDNSLKSHVLLDEVAPPPFATLVAFLVEGVNKGTYVLLPEDFYSEQELVDISAATLAIPNTTDAILHYNSLALSGQDLPKAKYLAMTIALGLFVRNALHLPDALNPETRRVNRKYLRGCTQQALEILQSGRAVEKLRQYVQTTQKYAGPHTFTTSYV